MTDAMESKTVSAHYGEEGGKKYLDSQHDLMRFGGWAGYVEVRTGHQLAGGRFVFCTALSAGRLFGPLGFCWYSRGAGFTANHSSCGGHSCRCSNIDWTEASAFVHANLNFDGLQLRRLAQQLTKGLVLEVADTPA